MAGTGFKLFANGEVLNASDVNTYLQQQTVMVFASAAARTTALSGVLAEGMCSYLQDDNTVYVYDGSAWVNIGNSGDITGVTAGTGLSGGGTSGSVTLSINTGVTADLTTAQTLTNKTLTSPILTTPNISTLTTAGDTLYGTGSGGIARLGIGTAGQVLKVNTGGTAPEWGTASGGSSGLTLIAANNFSGVSSVSRTTDFTTTYNYYRLIFNITLGSQNASAWMRFSTSGTDNTSSAYYLYGSPFTASAQNKMDLLRVNSSANTTNFLSFDIINPKVATQTLINALGLYQDSTNAGITYLGGLFNGTTQFDGWTILATGGTFEGSYAIYGYNK